MRCSICGGEASLYSLYSPYGTALCDKCFDAGFVFVVKKDDRCAVCQNPLGNEYFVNREAVKFCSRDCLVIGSGFKKLNNE